MVNTAQIRERFENKKYDGVVALIDILQFEASRNIYVPCIGISYDPDLAEDDEDDFDNYDVLLGHPDGHLSPIESLEEISLKLGDIPSSVMSLFDEACAARATLIAELAPNTGHA